MTPRAVLCALLLCAGCENDDPPVLADAGADAGWIDAGGTGPRDAGPAPDAGPPEGLSVLTLRLTNAARDGADRDAQRAQIVDRLTTLRPDAVCLQDAAESDDVSNTAEAIADALGYESSFYATLDLPTQREGIAVLAPYPIDSTEAAVMPLSDPGLGDRFVLAADLRVPGGAVRVFCTHLSTSDDEDAKADEAVAAYLFAESRRVERGSFFAGSMNAAPGSLAQRVLTGDATHRMTTGDFVDAWARSRPDDEGATAPASAPTRREDYVYAVPGTVEPSPSVIACERLFAEPVGGIYAAAHLGVLCTFER